MSNTIMHVVTNAEGATEHARLTDAVNGMEGGLEAKLNEGGESFA